MEPLVWKTTTQLQALKSSFTEHTAALLAALLKHTHLDRKLLLLLLRTFCQHLQQVLLETFTPTKSFVIVAAGSGSNSTMAPFSSRHGSNRVGPGQTGSSDWITQGCQNGSDRVRVDQTGSIRPGQSGSDRVRPGQSAENRSDPAAVGGWWPADTWHTERPVGPAVCQQEVSSGNRKWGAAEAAGNWTPDL